MSIRTDTKKDNRTADERQIADPDAPVIYFDGVCNLCNRSVQLTLKWEQEPRFYFASLQGAAGARAMEAVGSQQAESVILQMDGVYYTEAEAAYRIARELRAPMRWLAILYKVFPRSASNALYRWVAKNRYRMFGKRDTCMIPDESLKSRFLD